MAKTKQNLPTQYFTQTNRDKLEGWLFAGGVIGIVSFLICYLTFYWYFSMIGLYLGGSCIIAYIVITAKQVKDEHYDAHIKDYIEHNGLLPTSKYSLSIFECERGYIKLGKDRKIRSGIYCISEFEFSRDTVKISITEIDLCATAEGLPAVKNRKFTIPARTPHRIAESEIEIGESKRKIAHLILSPEGGSEIKLPIDQNSCDTDTIVDKLKRG